MTSKKVISIVICTYNRSEILEVCLSHIEKAEMYLTCEVLVIDNNSHDNTKEICKKFRFVTWLLEPKQGLSHARNRGILEASGDWLFYIDDDMYLHESSIDKLLSTIGSASVNVGVIGGSYDGYFTKKRPIWLSDSFISFKPFEKATIMKDMFVHGGIFCVKKSVFEKIGIFNTELGMSGEKMGYGEEEEFQYRCKKEGYQICFNPEISGSHLVGEHKYSWKWYLSSGYQLERDIVLSGRYKNQGIFKLLIKHFLLIGYNVLHFIKDNYKRLSLIYMILFFLRQISEYCGLISGIYQQVNHKSR